MKTDDKDRCTNCIHMIKVQREWDKNRHVRVCLQQIKYDPWSVLNSAFSSYQGRLLPCYEYKRQTADAKRKITLDNFIAEYFAPTQNNLLPQGFTAAIQEMSLKEAVQFRTIMRKGALTPLLGWQSENDRATTAAVQQALNAVEQAIENKANEE